MGTDSRVTKEEINRAPDRRPVEPIAVSGKTQIGEWINRLYARVLDLEAQAGSGGPTDPDGAPPTKYTTANLPLADAAVFGSYTVGMALPSLGDLKVQKDFNHYVYGVLTSESSRVDSLLVESKNWATTSWVTSQIKSYGYATESYVDQNYAPLNHKHPELAVDLNGYATEIWVTEQIAAIEHPEGGGGIDWDSLPKLP